MSEQNKQNAVDKVLAKENNIVSKKKKFGEKLRDNIQKLLVFAVSTVYICQGLFSLTKKESSILEILGDIGLSIVVGAIISATMNSMGIKDGRKSEMFENSMKSYGEAKAKSTKYFDKLQAWCEYKTRLNLKRKRKILFYRLGFPGKVLKSDITTSIANVFPKSRQNS